MEADQSRVEAGKGSRHSESEEERKEAGKEAGKADIYKTSGKEGKGKDMNLAILVGRLTREPEIRTKQKEDGESIVAMYTLAVDRRHSKDRDPQADFISIVAFGKAAEFVKNYCHKGTKLAIRGSIVTGSYTDRDGRKVYTTQVRAEEQEFCEPKRQQDEPSKDEYKDPYDEWAEQERMNG